MKQKCEKCGNDLIEAIDTEGALLVLVNNPRLYGKTWGNLHDVVKDGKRYELVRPALGIRHLHADVCRQMTKIEQETSEWV